MDVTEIYSGIQGEGLTVGMPSTFVRFAGCNLACEYCDTKFARGPGTRMTPQEIAEQIDQPAVVFTGGEPLLQTELLYLVRLIRDFLSWKHITIETNCTIWWPKLITEVNLWSLSPKLRSSLNPVYTVDDPDVRRTMLNYFTQLSSSKQQWKFVISGAQDLLQLRALLETHEFQLLGPIILQPEGSNQKALTEYLIEQVIHKKMLPRVHDIRIIPQVHVLLWGQQRRR